eukprot:1156722-Pelagomonas_calceolata.AAC.12
MSDLDRGGVGRFVQSKCGRRVLAFVEHPCLSRSKEMRSIRPLCNPLNRLSALYAVPMADLRKICLCCVTQEGSQERGR